MVTTEHDRDEDEHAALRPLLERVAARAPSDRAEVATALARAAYRRMPSEQLTHLDLDSAAACMVDAAAFVDARPPGELALRVFDPDADQHGWTAPGTVIEVNVEDGPFLLSTITEELGRLGLEQASLIHPIVGVERTGDGSVGRVLPARHAAHRESWISVQLDRHLDGDEIAKVDEALRAVLDDARRATADFPAMRRQVDEIAFAVRASAGAAYPREDVDETIALLEWLLDDHFVLLGYRQYDLVALPDDRRAVTVHRGSGLGILADERRSTYAEPVPLDDIPARLRARVEGGNLLVVSRTNQVSTVHRRERMLYVGVKRLDDEGTVAGEYRLLGLFAQKAYAEPASTIPVLRRKLQTILEREDFVDHSHDERSVRALFEAYPKYELFAADTDDLRRSLVELLEGQKRQVVRLLCRVDDQRHTVSALVAIPRDRFNAGVRKRVQQVLVDRFGGTGVDYHLSIGERDQALLHFVVHAGGAALNKVSADELEREIVALARTWQDHLRAALIESHGSGEGERLAEVWGGRFRGGYVDTVPVAEAVGDVAELATMTGDPDQVRMRVTDAAGDRHDLLRVRFYKARSGVELSNFVPILESLGLVVVEEVPHVIGGPGDDEIHLHDYGVRLRDAEEIGFDVERDGPRLADAAIAMWRGDSEADSLNRLVLRAGLGWQDVAVLRVYRRYRRQVGTAFTEAYQNDALCDHPQIARDLVGLFAAKFDPDRNGDHPDRSEARQRVLDGLDRLERLDQDRILRGYLGMVDATVRTNRYRRPQRSWFSLKFDSRQVPDAPKPVPHAEIYVYSPEMEGVHLRGGPVARGGLRWSDRLEDYRTEVLGLMKAQMVKNAVIVPTGSKGGFVLKHPPADRQELRDEVCRHYDTFVRGLLDVTDNVVAAGSSDQPRGVVAPPDRVRRADGDDPYLVVAADRGTATFSDLANHISEEYGFWLGDAFASGGSHGYDHKQMGITARGAWVAVQRHFRELDIDVQTEPITVVGIGDMSGDVFGNGLLRSRSVKLIAAFDHRDIFVDPDPDPETSFQERARLHELSGSSWRDYSEELLSPGGGVWSRSVKEIPLSPEAREALRIDAAGITPPDLIKAILAAPVDLLFAGGIGTFVKESGENNAEVGDRANDAIRVDARGVGARVIAEGGNLAVTQRGRMQYARRGGRINTDAIDNSAGVDTSDREVNLKILLQMAVERGRLPASERDDLLLRVADDVAAAVLRDVYLQTWTISQELAYSPGGMEAYERFMVDLGEAGRLDRGVESLPSPAEMARRREAGAGLTRPELAVLLAYSKTDLRARLLASDVPDQPALRSALAAYFPAAIRERYQDLLAEHRLRRELVATVLANDVVNRMGITYVSRTANELGCRAAGVVACYQVAREVCRADELWRSVEALDGRIDPALQLELKVEVDRLVDAFLRAYVRQGAGEAIAAAIDRDRAAFDELEKVVAAGTPPRRRGSRRAQADRWTGLGVEETLADRLAGLSDLAAVPDVAEVARARSQPVDHVADVFFALSDALPLERLHQRLSELEPDGHWERWQHRGLVDELRQMRRSGAAAALAAHDDLPGEETVERFLAARPAARERAMNLFTILEGEEDAGLPAFAVVVRALGGVFGP